MSGSSSIDESMLTGESVPIEKAVSSHVFAERSMAVDHCSTKPKPVGTLDTALARIVQFVEDAQGSKAISRTLPIASLRGLYRQ